MRSLAVVIASLVLAVSSARAEGWKAPGGRSQVLLWPRAPPDSTGSTGSSGPGGSNGRAESSVTERGKVGVVTGVSDVSRPTMTVFSPAAAVNTGVAVVVFPGGGYKILAIDLEGTDVCDWLTSKGMTCVVLKYRVPNGGRTGTRAATARHSRPRRGRCKTRSARSRCCERARPNGMSIRTRSE